MFEGQLAYVTASYAIFTLVVTALLIWIFVDGAAQKKALADLEKDSGQ